ncbi:MAG: hypothetical protein ACKVY0_29630 [Prosthecobacter sp.]|uniref:hypothetical protein n=1 Tax=Prosthecobacter sp. TaxID=1965333 RepID=UPI003902E6BC
MPLTVLTLRTADSLHELSCPIDASIDLGSSSECEIVLDGGAILPRHCVFRRVAEKRFRIQRAVPEAWFTVNGVYAPDLEVETPFQFSLGMEEIRFDLGVEGEEPPEQAEEASSAEEAGSDAPAEESQAVVRSNRRDYLLQPTAMKPRAGERVGEVIVESSPESAVALSSPVSVLEQAKAPEPAAADEAKHDEEESSSLLLTGLLVCGVMIAAIIYWNRHLDQVSSPPVAKVQVAVPERTHFTPEQIIRACEELRHAGAPLLAANLLMPLAEEGHVEAMQPLANALRASGEFGEEVVFLMQQAVVGGSRAALSDFVSVVDDADNPARYAESSFKQLQQAATLGEASAWMPLGERHEHGNGTVQDIKRALAAYEKAQADGDQRAEAKLSARQAALDRAAAFIRSWNEVSVATLLDHVAAAQGKFFMLDHPPMDALLRLEEEMRARWPLRRISVAAGAKAELENFDLIHVIQPFQFEVQRGDRTARGKGVLTCTVQRDEADKWRITDADDTIELTELLPKKEQFVSAASLRELKPAFTHEEQVEESRLEILRGMRGIEDTQDFKTALTVLMNAVYEFPQETFWKPFADTLCDRMARQLFADGKWLDAAWAEPVHQLSERGSVSAMLLEGHLLAAGYGFTRDEKRSTALYQKAFEAGKRRDARFYYAEALFQGRGVPQDIDKAGALVLSFMTRSKHPLEAYLAAHLLWRKAEINPALWQDVYDTLSRVTDKHPPAKNLAGMVLLNHGQTTKERKTGFAAIKAAAEEGVVEAMKTLANCYQEGIGSEKDFLTATTWKQKAAVTPPLRKKHYTEFEE